MFWRNKRRASLQVSVSVFGGSLGFWLLEPGLVSSDRQPYLTCETCPMEGNEVHFEPSVPLQSGTICSNLLTVRPTSCTGALRLRAGVSLGMRGQFQVEAARAFTFLTFHARA